MEVKFSEELSPDLEQYGSDLKIQGILLPEKEILETYLKGAYGNAYNFDQEDGLTEIF